MKWQGPLFVTVLIVGIVVVASIGETYSTRIPPQSSKNADPPGCLAFFLLMQEYTSVERIDTTLSDLKPGTLLMVDPVRFPSSAEEEYLFSWVNQGNRLIVFSEGPQIMEHFGVTLSDPQREYSVVEPEQGHKSTQNVKSLRITYSRYISSHQGDVLVEDEGNPIAVEISHGDGSIVLITAPSMVQNEYIDYRDNEIFLVQLALDDVVYFDEYYIYQQRGLRFENLRTLFTSRYSSVFIQLIIAFALFLMGYGKRFGVSRPQIPREVQSSELVVSAADLYYKAGKKEILDVVKNWKST